MKKIILSLVIVLTAYSLQAQKVAVGGFRRAGTNAQIKAMHKKELKDTLGLTDAQADKVDAIQQNYKLKIRAVKIDTKLADADRQSKVTQLNDERKAELAKVISQDQIAKMDGMKKAWKKAKKQKKHKTKTA